MPYFGEPIPMRNPTGYVEDDGRQPENSVRTTPDPLAGMRKLDPKAEQFIKGRRPVNPLTDPAQATRTEDLSEINPRTGKPYAGGERVRLTGSMPIDGYQMTDIAQAALRDNSNAKAPITATMNGVNYSYQPRIRVNDQKAQVYLADAAARRAEQTASEDKRAARAAAERDRSDKRYETWAGSLKDEFKADTDRRTAEREETRKVTAERLEQEKIRASNKVLNAQAETAAYDATPEGRQAKLRASVGEKLIESKNPNSQRAGAGMVGEALGVEGFENAVRGTYEDRVKDIRPLVEQYKKTLMGGGSTGYGMYQGEADLKRTQGIAALIRQRAIDAGLTPEEMQTLQAEMDGGDKGNTVWSALGNLFTLNG
jgi:hypothetical protein